MARSRTNDPVQQYKYEVRLEGLGAIGFSSADGLEESYEIGEYAEGGYDTNHKLPGKLITETATLEKGAASDMSLANWFRSALTDSAVRKTVTIIEKNHAGIPVRQHTLKECWASRFARPTYDATSSEVAIDTIELEYEGIETSPRI